MFAKKMNQEIVTALIGLTGIAAGAIFQFFITRYFEAKKESRERLLSTYKELVRALNALASAQNTKTDIIEARLKFETAKTQFILDGSPKSVKLFSEWTKQYGKLDTPEACMKFSALIKQLRSDCTEKSSDVSTPEINQILFPSETKSEPVASGQRR